MKMGETTEETPGELLAKVGSTRRSRIRRHSDRSVPTQVEAILRAGRVAHVAYVVDGEPYIIPFSYDYADATVYLHGAPASTTLKALRSGSAVCLEVLLLDGLIASKTAPSHSMNYRSVVVFGQARRVTDLAAKRAILERMTQRYFAGRTVDHDYAAASTADLKSLEVLAVAIDELNAKVRSGPPAGPLDTDPDAPGSAYVVTLPALDA